MARYDLDADAASIADIGYRLASRRAYLVRVASRFFLQRDYLGRLHPRLCHPRARYCIAIFLRLLLHWKHASPHSVRGAELVPSSRSNHVHSFLFYCPSLFRTAYKLWYSFVSTIEDPSIVGGEDLKASPYTSDDTCNINGTSRSSTGGTASEGGRPSPGGGNDSSAIRRSRETTRSPSAITTASKADISTNPGRPRSYAAVVLAACLPFQAAASSRASRASRTSRASRASRATGTYCSRYCAPGVLTHEPEPSRGDAT